MSRTVSIVRTGIANLASVIAALRRLDVEVLLIDRPEAVRSADRLVLPGVGAFGAAVDEIDSRGLREPLIERVRSDRPLLAICLGLQLLAEASDESPGVRGLALLSGSAVRFSGSVRVPQLGWNRVVPDEPQRVVELGHAYFANSYFLSAAPVGWSAAWSDHGRRFVASVERGSVVGCQFHPELSGAFGRDLLKRWIAC